jgi:uncharacterized membrane protein
METLPISLAFFVTLWLLLGLFVLLIAGGVLRHISRSLGVSASFILLILVLCLVGSSINIPVARLAGGRMHSSEVVEFFGFQYLAPVVIRRPATIIAVNVGGAVIPSFLSLFLLLRQGDFFKSVVATVWVALIVHQTARLVPGVGIATPSFLPPVTAALLAVMLSRRHAGSVAYIAGSMGTLIGADLMNLYRIRGLDAPVASIGGAGTYDAIFLTGLIAVLLAGVWGGAAPSGEINGWQGRPPAFPRPVNR